ncbi:MULTISPECIES: AI-2E family transporter [unclassified Microbacterium]|uniref:AI-2E family transporter n=1 Tax=unclassified Microbacterium TaxID=2609290 RepID=UPI0006F5BCCF|nr:MULTISPECIES: AI-2E family transporter [unclassified Microbacterium]KQP74042.1 permease [Microbacterium sp. Leaf288]MDT0142486.1 AI-2E family transporter [Microbacterium sp. PRC9]
MTDASPTLGATAAEAAEPLSVDAAAGTDSQTTTSASVDGAVDTAPEDTPVFTGEAPAGKTFWANLNSPFRLGLVLTLGALAAVALGLAFWNLSTIIIYVVFALFAALGLDPVVRWFGRHNVSRPWAIVIVYTAFALVLAGILLLVVPTLIKQISAFFTDLPTTIANFQKSDFYGWLSDTFGSQVGQITDQVEKFLTNPANIAAIGGGVVNFAVSVGTTISGLIIVLVLSLYFLAGLPNMKVAFNRFAAARNRKKAAAMTDQITDSIGAYLMGMVVLAFCNSVVAFLLHLFLGLPFPALMGVLAFLITLIPLIGSVLYWLTATTLALFTGWVPALIFAVIYLVYMQLEAYVLTPKVMNKAISVPGALVVIGAMVGGTLLGLLGALVAIPVTASILLIIKQVFIPKQDAKI